MNPMNSKIGKRVRITRENQRRANRKRLAKIEEILKKGKYPMEEDEDSAEFAIELTHKALQSIYGLSHEQANEVRRLSSRITGGMI